MKEVLKIENGIIIEHSIVDRELRANEIEVQNWNGTVGEPLTFYNDDYSRKSDIELYEQGLKEIPQGFKLEKGELVELPQEETPPPKEKSYVERIKDGESQLPLGMKIENDELVPMTQDEILKSNLPTEFKKNTLIGYLYSTDWVVIKTLELQLSGKKATHDYSDILAEREKARTKINELESEKKK